MLPCFILLPSQLDLKTRKQIFQIKRCVSANVSTCLKRREPFLSMTWCICAVPQKIPRGQYGSMLPLLRMWNIQNLTLSCTLVYLYLVNEPFLRKRLLKQVVSFYHSLFVLFSQHMIKRRPLGHRVLLSLGNRGKIAFRTEAEDVWFKGHALIERFVSLFFSIIGGSKRTSDGNSWYWLRCWLTPFSWILKWV